ncbi:MAG: hypothetical protein ACK5B3_02495 [Bacteroidota bacterium]|jgi:hypothetical protein
MRLKLYLSALLISSFFVYLSWSKTSSAFLFQMEFEILTKLFNNPLSVLHPFTIIPLIGQVLLLISLLQKQPNNLLMKLGISSLLFLIGFIFIVGILSLQLTIIISTVPFISLAVLSFLEIKRNNKPVL